MTAKKEISFAPEVKAGVLTLRNVTVKDAGRSLSSMYSATRKRLFDPFVKMVRDGQLTASPVSTGKMLGYMRDLTAPQGFNMIPDTGQTQLYNAFCADLMNVVAVAKADKRYEEAWKRLVTSLEVNSADIRQQLGRSIEVATGYSWYAECFAELLFSPLVVVDIWDVFSRNYSERARQGILSMRVSTRARLSDIFFGKEYRLPHLYKELPERQTLAIEGFEQSIATDLMTLDGVALNGSLLSSNGSISAASVKKVKSQTGIADFAITKRKWPLDRVELLCLTFFTLLNAKGKDDKSSIDIMRLARFVVDNMARWLIGPIFSSFIPDMQGFAKTWTNGSHASKIAGVVQAILMQANLEWIDLSNFRMQLLCSDIEGNNNYSFLKLFSDDGRRKGKPVRKADKERGISQPTEIDWWEEVGWKFAIHWMRYLCAMGIVDLAMDPDANDDDPMEGMRYARLTPLGRYALRIDDDYTPKASNDSMGVEFDQQNGILTIDSKSPFQLFLDNVAKRISPTRFRISEETLLKGCKTKAELEQRIKNLRVIIDPEQQPALKKIMEDAMKRTDCAVREGGYSMLRLRPDLPGLRDAILTNHELRQMTILAGPSLALVKTHKMERFNAILAAYGYLMD